jgi:hypothetical protein
VSRVNPRAHAPLPPSFPGQNTSKLLVLFGAISLPEVK